MPKVSVIVPNYNHERFLRQRIDSILAQTFRDFELILLDDCSTDDSREILQEYASNPHVTHVEFNEANSGSTFKQWNKGVRLARGKYVWIAESDDYADPRLLETLVSRLDAAPSAVLGQCRSWRVIEGGGQDGFADSWLSCVDPRKWTADFVSGGIEECRTHLCRRNTVLSASSVLFRRDAYLQAGSADESFVLGGDWKIWASMALTGSKLVYVAEPLNYYRFHDRSVSRTAQTNGICISETLRIISWIFSEANVDRVIRAEVCRDLYQSWGPALFNRSIGAATRWAIFGSVIRMDARAPGRILRSTLTAIRLATYRRYKDALRRLVQSDPQKG